MSLYGALKTMTLPDLFQWLKASRKSGVLTIIAGEEERSLYFQVGRIEAYTSRELRESLGQLLVGFGLVSESDIAQAYRVQRQTHKPLARVLLDEGFISDVEVKSFLGEAARDIVFDLFLEEEGSFVFSDSKDLFDYDEAPFERVPLELDMEEAILEGMRRMDEWSSVRAKLSNDTMRLVPVGDEWKNTVKKPSREWRIFSAVERRLSLGEICLELRASRYSVYRVLYRGLDEKLLRIDEAGAAAPHEHADEDRVRRLLTQAEQMLHAKQWDEAATLYDLIARINPQDAVAREGAKRAHAEQAAELYQTLPPVSVPKLAIERERLRAFNLNSEELFLASRINGDWDVGSLVMVSPLAELQTLKTLSKLLHIGVIDFK